MQLLKLVTTVTMQLCTVGLMLPMWASAQNVSTIAGTGIQGFGGDNAAATAAQLARPMAVLARADGSVLIADYFNNRVRKIDVGGTITTFAGNGVGSYGGDGGQANLARISDPGSLVVDAAGNVYIGSTGAIRKVTPAGIISTIAGTGTSGNTGNGGQATLAEVGSVWGMRFDSAGNLFFTDYVWGVVRKIDTTGIITRVAGAAGGATGENVDALTALLSQPVGIVVDADGSIVVAAHNNQKVRRFMPGGNINTIAGDGTTPSNGDGGAATSAGVDGPWGLESDGEGGYFVAELNGNRIRKISSGGIASTVIGTPIPAGGGQGASTNTGDGASALLATIFGPAGLYRSSNNHLFMTSYQGHTVRKITYPPLLLRPNEVSSRITHSAILKVSDDTFRRSV